MTIKELRTQTGMSQSQFAKYFNIPPSTLKKWEQGQRQCPEYLLDLIEYKLNMEYFLYCKASTLPVGYDYINGEIVVNEKEAEFVKEAFESHLRKSCDTKHSKPESIVSQDVFDKAQEKMLIEAHKKATLHEIKMGMKYLEEYKAKHPREKHNK